MAEPARPAEYRLRHFLVTGSGSDESYRGRAGMRPPAIREIPDRRQHADRLSAELNAAKAAARLAQTYVPVQSRGDGFTLTVVGWSPEFRLALESLDTRGAKLLSVSPATEETPERALIWIPFASVAKFVAAFEQFATELTDTGKPKNQALVANIQELRLSVLREFWQEDSPFPDPAEPRWWEVWLVQHDEKQNPVAALRQSAEAFEWRVADEALTFPYRHVTLVHASANQLSNLLTTNAIPGELRRPDFAEEFLDLDRTYQAEFVNDLALRVLAADPSAPAVCVLDCGILAGHPLLKPSVDGTYTVVQGTTAAPVPGAGHGTEMAGLALYGELTPALLNNLPVRLSHRLESVKILRGHHDNQTDPDLYGQLLREAASRVEIDNPRPRVYSMAVTSNDRRGCDGRPTSWSAAIDALAMGTDIGQSQEGIDLLGAPDPEARRLFLVSAGNVRDWQMNYLDHSDTRQISDPAQAWNALTVGAFTERDTPPTNPAFAGYRALAERGELSPFSRTSVMWGAARGRPLKPDVVLEGGNLLVS